MLDYWSYFSCYTVDVCSSDAFVYFDFVALYFTHFYKLRKLSLADNQVFDYTKLYMKSVWAYY